MPAATENEPMNRNRLVKTLAINSASSRLSALTALAGKARQPVAQIKLWLFTLKSMERGFEVAIECVGELDRRFHTARSADQDRIPEVWRGQLWPEQALICLQGQQTTRSAGFEIAGQSGVAADCRHRVLPPGAEHIEPNLVPWLRVQLSSGSLVDHDLAGINLTETNHVSVRIAHRIKPIDGLRVNADQEELRLHLPGLWMLDWLEVESRSEDRLNTIVSRKVRTQILHYLVRDPGSRPPPPTRQSLARR